MLWLSDFILKFTLLFVHCYASFLIGISEMHKEKFSFVLARARKFSTFVEGK